MGLLDIAENKRVFFLLRQSKSSITCSVKATLQDWVQLTPVLLAVLAFIVQVLVKGAPKKLITFRWGRLLVQINEPDVPERKPNVKSKRLR